ncbi:hypothetical protein ALP75_203313 [Pseudomonas syringae pv. actinidiae]|nr:hypothetical protein ALP75_203313 [Pseudomonas syringae pv. actinidiae]
MVFSVNSSAPKNSATPADSRPTSSRVICPGRTRLSKPIASASNSTPIAFFTVTSQGPLFGSQVAPPVAISSNGAPMPRPSANSFNPPPTASPLALIYSRAPASGAETQGETSRLDTTPNTAAPHSDPPSVLPAMRSRRELIDCGRRSSKAPNMAMAKITKNAENGTSTHADCRRACRLRLAPNIPISAPSKAKQAAIGST